MVDKIKKKIIDSLLCPITKEPLVYNPKKNYFFTKNHKKKFKIVDGIPVLK